MSTAPALHGRAGTGLDQIGDALHDRSVDLDEASLDDAVHLAAHLCRVPMAAAIVATAAGRRTVNRRGLDMSIELGDLAPVVRAIQVGRPVVVADARLDPELAGSPLLDPPVSLTFLAACPLAGPDGSVIGALVLADRAPRALGPVELDLLQRIARRVDPGRLGGGPATPSRALITLTRADLQRVLGAMSQGVVVHAADASIQMVNPAAERILGLSADQMRGVLPVDPRWEAIHRDGSPFPGEHHPASISLRHGVEVREVVMGVCRPDGSRRWVLINSMPMELPPFGERGCVATFSDITELTELNDQLQESLRELASAAQERAALLSSVSHDLRAPLASIRMMTELLEDRAEAITAQQRRELVHRVRVEARRTEGVLADLVSANRVGSGLDAPRRQLVDLDDLVRMVARDFSNDDHEVRLGLLEGDLRISADRAQLERILDNLVSNAIRHTPAGSVVVVGAVEHERSVELTVDDDGPGVADELKQSVFAPYVRGERSADRPGSGLGLFLVQQFAQFHGGQTWCEDSPLGGARFVVSLPL